MLKVLVVMPCYYPAMHYGGPITAVHQMNKALLKENIDVTVYTTNANGATTLDVPLCNQVVVDGVKVHYFPVRFGGRYFYAPKLAVALRRTLKEFDLVHINWMYVYPTMVASRLCMKMGIPYVLTPHGMLDSHSISLKGFLRKKLYIMLIEKRHILDAAVIHYSSMGEKKGALISNWSLNFSIVPNGVDLQGNPTRSPDQDNYTRKFSELSGKKIVLSMGRLNYIKGLDLLIKSWSQVVRKVKDAHLVIAGPDSDGYRNMLEKLAISEGVADYITFTGMVVEEEKIEVFSMSKVFVSSSHLESFGMSIVEAMSYGLPVVVTDRVNIHTEIEDAGAGLVAICESQSIAANILTILLNAEAAKKMGESGRELVMKDYEIGVARRKMVELYRSIIN